MMFTTSCIKNKTGLDTGKDHYSVYQRTIFYI
jgi:hypothetical protein